MIEEHQGGFTIKLDEEQRKAALRTRAELLHYFKHGSTELPANWNEGDVEKFITQEDTDAKAKIEAEGTAPPGIPARRHRRSRRAQPGRFGVEHQAAS